MAQLVAARLVELLDGGHRNLIKLVEMTRFICMTRYATSRGLPCQRASSRGPSSAVPAACRQNRVADPARVAIGLPRSGSAVHWREPSDHPESVHRPT